MLTGRRTFERADGDRLPPRGPWEYTAPKRSSSAWTPGCSTRSTSIWRPYCWAQECGCSTTSRTHRSSSGIRRSSRVWRSRICAIPCTRRRACSEPRLGDSASSGGSRTFLNVGPVPRHARTPAADHSRQDEWRRLRIFAWGRYADAGSCFRHSSSLFGSRLVFANRSSSPPGVWGLRLAAPHPVKAPSHAPGTLVHCGSTGEWRP